MAFCSLVVSPDKKVLISIPLELASCDSFDFKESMIEYNSFTFSFNVITVSILLIYPGNDFVVYLPPRSFTWKYPLIIESRAEVHPKSTLLFVLRIGKLNCHDRLVRNKPICPRIKVLCWLFYLKSIC